MKCVEVAIVVEVGRAGLLDPDNLVLVARAEALLEDPTVEDVAQLRLDHGAGAGHLDVLDRDDAHQLAVHVEGRADPEVTRRQH